MVKDRLTRGPLVLDLRDIMNAEFRELAAEGCPLIQVRRARRGHQPVRHELGLPEARVRAADPKLYFARG